MQTREMYKHLTVGFVFLLVCQFILPSAVGAQVIETNPTPNIHKTIVIPVYSNDETPETSISQIVEKMETVRDFYVESSYSKVTFHSDILGWVKLENNLSSYVKISHYPNGAERVTVEHSIFVDIIRQLDNGFDFSKYDTLIVVHAGKSDQQAFPDEGDYIGTCYVPTTFYADGVGFNGASIVSEFDTSATICHELGHRLGADDLYDYLQDNISLGPWCLMSSGDEGFCGYTKESLGFIEEHQIFYLENGNYRLTLSPLSYQVQGYRIIKHGLSDGRTLYIEARDAENGFDNGLPSSGLLVYFINETSIADRRGGNEVIWYDDTALNQSLWWKDAVLRVGESIGLADQSISIRYVETNQDGYIVDVSTEIEEGWILNDRFHFEDDTSPVDIDVVWTRNYRDEIIYYAAVVISRNSRSALQIYNSTNFGREWLLQYDSGEEFNISSLYNDFVYYDYNLWYIGIFQQEGEWIVGAGVYLDYSNRLGIWNLTKFFNTTQRYGLSASSDSENMYIGLTIGESTNRSFCCIRRYNNTWYSTIIPTNGVVSKFDLSNPLEAVEKPWFSFYNNTGKYIMEFETGQMVKLDDDRCNDIHIAKSSDHLVTVSHSVENTTVYLRVHQWSVATGTTVLLNKEVTIQKIYCVFSGPLNNTWLLAIYNNTLYLYTFGEGSMKTESITELPTYPQNLCSPSINSEYYIFPLIIHYSSSEISTLTYGSHPPDEPELVLWFYQKDSNSSDNVIFFVGVIVLILFVIIFMGILIDRTHSK